MGIEVKKITSSPVPVWHAPSAKGVSSFDLHDLAMGKIDHAKLVEDIWGIAFHGTEIEHLKQVLSSGIDISPSDGVLSVGVGLNGSKGFEYPPGVWPKMVLALDPSKLERAYIDLPVDAPPEEVKKTLEIYPHSAPCKGESYRGLIHYSKISAHYHRFDSLYEREYAYWIPGEPFEALHAIFLFGESPELCKLIDEI